MLIMSVREMKKLNQSIGHNWFNAGTMQFWNTSIVGNKCDDQGYFISCEDNFKQTKRFYTVRRILETGVVETISKFQEFETSKDAKNWLKQYKEGLK